MKMFLIFRVGLFVFLSLGIQILAPQVPPLPENPVSPPIGQWVPTVEVARMALPHLPKQLATHWLSWGDFPSCLRAAGKWNYSCYFNAFLKKDINNFFCSLLMLIVKCIAWKLGFEWFLSFPFAAQLIHVSQESFQKLNSLSSKYGCP